MSLPMFKNMRTGTKLLVLCSTFLVSIFVPVHALITEKQIAIEFARKELSGSRYLTTIRAAYATILAVDAPGLPLDDVERELAASEARWGGDFRTGDLSRALVTTLAELRTNRPTQGDARVLEALAKAEALTVRVGDDSNLALDPDLDSYYVQSIVVRKLPALLGRLAQLQNIFETRATTGTAVGSNRAELPILESLVRAMADEVRDDLKGAYRGNADGRVRAAMDSAITRLLSSLASYLGVLGVGVDGRDGFPLQRYHWAVVSDALGAWEIAHAELDRLLRQRISEMTRRMLFGLTLIGVVAGLSVLIAVLTHHHIVRPLQRLEAVALKVREAKDYGLRVEHQSNDEIGRVTAAFNEMLAELATARKREMMQQAELARATRLSTMAEMTASIAHEVNQPLSAIVTSGHAGLRWLSHATPDLSRVQAALQRVVRDGQRAGEVVGSVRAMFKRDTQDRSLQHADALVDDVLQLLRDDLQSARISVDTEFRGSSLVRVDRVQLQQVLLNLMTNAIDAISATRPDRPRWLKVKVQASEPKHVMVSVEDSGSGIEPHHMEQVFDPFFTTKAGGMGLGLSICRSIVEAHGGRLSVSAGSPHGTVFTFTLPAHDTDELRC